MFADGINRHQFKDDVAKSTVPAIEQTPAGFFGQNAVERVEKLGLLWGYKVPHNRSKCLLLKSLYCTRPNTSVNTKI
ncbi:MAG: hypothetical protein J7K65_04860, partial [Planctomycetes bacterium]|nr:hypothetical protein [Planctomycetota bacterium]